MKSRGFKGTVSLCIVMVILAAFTLSSYAVKPSFSLKYPELADEINKAVLNHDEAYVIPSGYEITLDELFDVMYQLNYGCPMHFMRETGYRYFARTDAYGNVYATSITFDYKLTAEETESALVTVNGFIDKIISDAPSNMTDFEKVLYYHDYIASVFDYDNSLQVHDVYEFIKNGKGVCLSYVLMYAELLKRAGIENSWAWSEEMNHIWNCVKLNGKWYHVDVNWDATSSDIPGVINHKYFLLNDGEISTADNKHYGWVSPVCCDGEEYKDSVVRTVRTAVAPSDGKWYFIDGTGNLCYTDDPSSGEEPTVVSEHSLVWKVWDKNAHYTYVYSSLAAYDGIIYYTTPTQIMAYYPTDGTEKAVCTYGGNNGYIYGMKLGGYSPYAEPGKALINISKEPKTGTITEADLLNPKIEPVSTRGDVNRDGKITVTDVTTILKYLANWGVALDTDAADANNDGKVNVSDVTYLLKYIAGWDVIL